MPFFFIALFAGMMTVLAPCVFALLPIILNGSLGQNKFRPLIIGGSLVTSIFVFSLLIKGSFNLVNIPEQSLRIASGILISVIGLMMIFPNAWEWVGVKLKFYKSEELLGQNAIRKEGLVKDVLSGVALGPVFSSCSPTYGLLISSVLPKNFWEGSFYLLVYCIGLLIPLLAIGYGGRKVSDKLKFAVNPNGWFKRVFGLVTLLIGIAFLTGFDRTIEVYLLDIGLVNINYL